MAASAQVSAQRATFRQQCAVEIDIAAPAATVWALLTDAAGLARWNSTVTSCEGRIALGERLALQVPAAPGRTFRPRVTVFDAPRRMVWSDGFAPMFQGVRTYTLAERSGQGTRFRMEEVFTGAMLPMIRGSLPDFAPIFERYALDLQRAAEEAARTRNAA